MAKRKGILYVIIQETKQTKNSQTVRTGSSIIDERTASSPADHATTKTKSSKACSAAIVVVDTSAQQRQDHTHPLPPHTYVCVCVWQSSTTSVHTHFEKYIHIIVISVHSRRRTTYSGASRERFMHLVERTTHAVEIKDHTQSICHTINSNINGNFNGI